jgi:hypothetical protein
MKKTFLAALTILGLGVTALVANAMDFGSGSTIAADASATRIQQTGSYQ